MRADGKAGWDSTEQAYPKRKEQLSKVLQTGNAPCGGRLLELGCGAGNIAAWLARQGYDVTGIDISPTAIDWARSGILDGRAGPQFVVGDMRDLKDFGSGTFDCVLDGHCFHCIIGAVSF